MGLKELLNKYDNGSFPKDGWFSLGNEELKDIPQSEETENQDKAIRKIGEIQKQGEEERKE